MTAHPEDQSTGHDTEIIDESERSGLINRVTKNEDILRKLKLAKSYKKKEMELDNLISKWQKASRAAVLQLTEAVERDPKPTKEEILLSLNIDPKLLNFDAAVESSVAM